LKAQARYFNQEVNFLREVRLFQQFKKSSCVRMIQNMTTRSLKKGSYIFREGQKAEHIYIVTSGDVEILKNDLEKKLIALSDRIMEGTVPQFKSDAINSIFKQPRRRTQIHSLCIASRFQVLGYEDALKACFDQPLKAKEKSFANKD
jgi:CRP-like cAMP-binding protein